MTIHHGSVPWIAIMLAITLLFLFPAAFTYICYLAGKGAFPSAVPENDFLLPLAGVVTAIPLLWFSAAARRLRLATIGFMQYITPTLHFILAVLVFGEPFSQIELSSSSVFGPDLPFPTHQCSSNDHIQNLIQLSLRQTFVSLLLDVLPSPLRDSLSASLRRWLTTQPSLSFYKLDSLYTVDRL